MLGLSTAARYTFMIYSNILFYWGIFMAIADFGNIFKSDHRQRGQTIDPSPGGRILQYWAKLQFR